MRMDELLAATAPGDPEVIRNTATQLATKIRQTEELLGAMSFALDLERPRDGAPATPHWREGVALRDRLRGQADQAVEARDAMRDYAAAIEAQQLQLAHIVEPLAWLDDAFLLPLELSDAASTMPWWTWTRLLQSLAVRLGDGLPAGPRMLAAASPALIDAVYLVLSELRRQAVPGAVNRLPLGAVDAVPVSLAGYLDAGTTIAAPDLVMAPSPPTVAEGEPILRSADRVAVLITADCDTLCLCQSWTAPGAAVVAEGDGVDVRLYRSAPAEVAERLLQVAGFGTGADVGVELVLPRGWSERLLSPDAIVRTRAARRLAEVATDPVLAEALANDAWRSIALSGAFRDGDVADGAAGWWLSSADRVWEVVPGGEGRDAARLRPVNAEEVGARFSGIVDAGPGGVSAAP